jgi:hypothetical protein
MCLPLCGPLDKSLCNVQLAAWMFGAWSVDQQINILELFLYPDNTRVADVFSHEAKFKLFKVPICSIARKCLCSQQSSFSYLPGVLAQLCISRLWLQHFHYCFHL